jgi:exodeoxyribonuclease VII large subunit
MDSPFPDDEGNSRLLAEAKAGSNAPALSVSEISNALKRTVEDRFGHVRVRGEISGFKRAASGHLYFSLKDADAKLDGVMWKGNADLCRPLELSDCCRPDGTRWRRGADAAL